MVGPTLFASSKLPLKSMMIAKFVKCWHWHSVAVSDVDTSRHPSELQEFLATSQKTHVGSKSENIRKFNYSQHISQLVSLQQITCCFYLTCSFSCRLSTNDRISHWPRGFLSSDPSSGYTGMTRSLSNSSLPFVGHWCSNCSRHWRYKWITIH